MELYTLGQDDIVGNTTPRENPVPIKAQREACRAFFFDAHKVITILLGHLDKHLGLQTGTLASLCPIDKQSDTSLRLLQSHPRESPVDAKRITLGGHTDIGTITLLSHVIGGLQILPAGCENSYENWQYIKPQPNCALVNIGDTLVEWTGGLLRSSLHRVVAAPGEQANVPRQSLAYLVRAERNASMQRLKSEVIPAVKDGEEEDLRTVTEWAAERAGQIIRGELTARTHGGRNATVRA
jgi:isopenicillin N synthase-like dioxygenase